jgi:hypothetical protein
MGFAGIKTSSCGNSRKAVYTKKKKSFVTGNLAGNITSRTGLNAERKVRQRLNSAF